MNQSPIQLTRTKLFLVGAIAFTLGYVAHVVVGNARYEEQRAALQTYYASAFPLGEVFDPVAAASKHTGLTLTSEPNAHRYSSPVEVRPDPSRRYHLEIETDSSNKIQKVSVAEVLGH